MGLPIAGRCLLAGVLLIPLGILMGMPLPIGMRLFHDQNDLVPWSWGVNSATSVLGAILAVVVAMNAGFTVTLLFGTLLYLLALIPVFKSVR
jgi:ABC-type Mn2+/Zn2+ transport system permease subunit